MIWLQLQCNSHFLEPPPRNVADKIFLPVGAPSNTLGRDGLVVVWRVSFGRFGGQEGLVGQAVASSVDLWVLNFGFGGFGVADFSGSGVLRLL